MDRIPTHVPGLDAVLHGGLPANSTLLISGVPGSGKTTLATQILFGNATPERRGLFISTVSEPQSRLLRYVQQYAFFQAEKVNTAIHFEDLGIHLLEKNGDTALRRIEELVLQYQPAFLVVDSFRSLVDLSEHLAATRRGIFHLAASLAALSCTTLLVGEYCREDIPHTVESTIVDGILLLENTMHEQRDLRGLRVIKLRGSAYEAGEHSCKITAQGMQIFPRFRTPAAPQTYTVQRERARVGIPGFDDVLLPGGLLRGTVTLTSGDPGVGKTVTALHYLLNGARAGETGAYITFQENPSQLARIAQNFGFDFEGLQKRGRLHLMYKSPVELDLDEHAYAILHVLEESRARRVVIDSISDLEASARRGPDRFFDFIYSLSEWLKSRGITALLTTEMGQIFSGSLTLTGRGISHIADNILLLRYAEVEGEIRRALTMLSARGSDHNKAVFEYLISEEEGPRLGKPLRSAFNLFQETTHR